MTSICGSFNLDFARTVLCIESTLNRLCPTAGTTQSFRLLVFDAINLLFLTFLGSQRRDLTFFLVFRLVLGALNEEMINRPLTYLELDFRTALRIFSTLSGERELGRPLWRPLLGKCSV